jgi:hypothetical protein
LSRLSIARWPGNEEAKIADLALEEEERHGVNDNAVVVDVSK